jgi:hypothetical protein
MLNYRRLSSLLLSCLLSVVYFLISGLAVNARSDSFEKQIIDFSGKIREDGVIELSWETSKEKNILQFEIEYSTDDKHYEKFTTISSHNSKSNNSYKAYHAIACNGKVSYRIKVIDPNGESLYSDRVVLELKIPEENQQNSIS